MTTQVPARESDTVGVAVLNQPVPVVRSRSEARRAYLWAAHLVVGIAAGEPNLDLLVFPEYGNHGVAQEASSRRSLVEPGEELEILGRACREAGVWIAVSETGGAVRHDARHRMALLNDRGEVVARHVTGPVGVGRAGPRIVDGPRGVRTALTFADAASSPAVEPAIRGAELVVQYRVDPSARPGEVVRSARCLAWTNACYVASANAAGSDGTHRWAGFSSVVGYDGTVLGLCEDEEYELQYTELALAELRRSRAAREVRGRADAASLRRPPSHPHPPHLHPPRRLALRTARTS
jgi:amidase